MVLLLTLPEQLFASARARRRFFVHLVIGVVLFVGGAVLLRRQLAFLFDTEAVLAFVSGFGAWAPPVLIVLQVLQVILAPIPGQVLAAAAGYLFGPWLGTLYNMIGITVGSTIAFGLSRRYGRAYLERMFDHEVLGNFDAFVEQHGLVGLFILFLIPGLPDDALCFVGGLTPIPFWKLVVIAFVGRAPAFFVVNVFGHLVARGDFHTAMAVLILFGGLSLLGYVNRDRISTVLGEKLP